MITASRRRPGDVGLGDAADRGLQDLDLHLGMFELAEFLLDGLDRAAHVGPEDDVQRRRARPVGQPPVGQPLAGILERDLGRRAGQRPLPRLRVPLFGDLRGPGRCRGST